MEKKKMLLITHGYPFGESERSFISEEIKQLEEHFELTVMAILYDDSDRVLRHELSGRFRTVKFSFIGRSRKNTLRSLTDKAALKEIRSVVPNINRVKKVLGFVNRSFTVQSAIERVIKKHGADIIYTYWCTEETCAAVRLKSQYPQLKVISRLHGYDVFKERDPLGIQPMHSYVADKADLLVFASRDGMEYFRRNFPGKAKTMVSYLGARGFQKLPAERECSYNIVSCSSLIPLKRVERIAEAVSLVKNVKLHWVHIGSGGTLENVKRAAGDCSFELLGQLPNDAVSEIYQRYSPDLFITASSTEGLPVSIAEAYSCCIPAIGTSVGGIPEIIVNGETGYLVSADADAAELAAAIERFYLLPAAQRIQMNKSAYTFYSDVLNSAENAKRFIKKIKELL